MVAGVDYRNVNKLINKNQIVFSGIITVPGGVQSISSQCGAQDRSIRVTCELVRNVNSQDPGGSSAGSACGRATGRGCWTLRRLTQGPQDKDENHTKVSIQVM